MKIFSICLQNNEFEVVGLVTGSQVEFQSKVNGTVFFQSANYDEARAEIVNMTENHKLITEYNLKEAN